MKSCVLDFQSFVNALRSLAAQVGPKAGRPDDLRFLGSNPQSRVQLVSGPTAIDVAVSVCVAQVPPGINTTVFQKGATVTVWGLPAGVLIQVARHRQ